MVLSRTQLSRVWSCQGLSSGRDLSTVSRHSRWPQQEHSQEHVLRKQKDCVGPGSTFRAMENQPQSLPATQAPPLRGSSCFCFATLGTNPRIQSFPLSCYLVTVSQLSTQSFISNIYLQKKINLRKPTFGYFWCRLVTYSDMFPIAATQHETL